MFYIILNDKCLKSQNRTQMFATLDDAISTARWIGAESVIDISGSCMRVIAM